MALNTQTARSYCKKCQCTTEHYITGSMRCVACTKLYDSSKPKKPRNKTQSQQARTERKTSTRKIGLFPTVKQPGFGGGTIAHEITLNIDPAGVRDFTYTKAAWRSKFAGKYNPAVDMQPSHHPGSMDAFSKPSRVGDTLYFRDGRTQHSPIQYQPKTVFLAP